MSTVTETLRRPGAAPGADSGAARDYRLPVAIFMVIVFAHVAEHVAQAIQVFVLGWARPDAGGVLGLLWPWLVKSEWLHYGYAVVMLIGLILLRGGFHGQAHSWWMAALWIQVWHHFEHALLLLQALLSQPFFGRDVPTSIVQLAFQRIELHIFYNAVVIVPMVVAVYLQFLQPPALRAPDGQRA
jgi:hypothetical protein